MTMGFMDRAFLPIEARVDMESKLPRSCPFAHVPLKQLCGARSGTSKPKEAGGFNVPYASVPVCGIIPMQRECQ